jgi:hypothetical protein
VREFENSKVKASDPAAETGPPCENELDAGHSARLQAFDEYRPLLTSIAYRMLGGIRGE